MIVIRALQMARFSAERRRQFVDDMCSYLRKQFHEELWAVEQNDLHQQVDAALARAASYGLYSERDCCRYLNLAVTYGWDFDRREALSWMRNILTDSQVSSASQRLHRLVDQCIYRSEVEESNRRLRYEYELETGDADARGGDEDEHIEEEAAPLFADKD